MVVVPLSQSTTEFVSPKSEDAQPAATRPAPANEADDGQASNWVRTTAVCSLALSGVLLMSGRRRAGLVAAVSGTALAMLDQQNSIKAWWETLPVYLEEVQLMLNRAQGAVEGAAAQREKLRRIFNR